MGKPINEIDLHGLCQDEAIRVIDEIRKYAEVYGSFYLYDEQAILDRIAALKANFRGVEFIYSIKCNSYLPVVQSIVSQGIGVDAASSGEVSLARKLGVSKTNIFYSAPGKTVADLGECLDSSTIIADSIGELERINKLAESGLSPNSTVEVGVRINPDFDFNSDDGIPSKFGIDESDAMTFIRNNQLKNIHINGMHVHIKSQVLSEEQLLSYYSHILELAERAEYALGYALDYINMGSGIGIKYSDDETDLDIEKLGGSVSDIVEKYKVNRPETRIIIESGRYIVGPCGYYVTHVVDYKISHGKKYVILQNTLNGFLRPSLAKLVEKYALSEGDDGEERELAGTEPLYSCRNAYNFITDNDSEAREVVTLVGNLCTSADVIAEDISLPPMKVGDVLIIPNAGSYAAVLSPMQFSSQKAPAEIMLKK